MSRFAKIVKLDQDAVKSLSESYQLGHHDDITYAFRSERGLTEKMVSDLSIRKEEPSWMRDLRQRAFGLYQMMPLPNFGDDLSVINWEEIYYYLAPTGKESKTWAQVPDAIKRTFDKIGVPEAEQGMLSGVKAQYDSEVVYGSLRKSLSKKGVVFLGMDEGLRQYPELVREYFSKIVPLGDNKLAALNSAMWSGGSFIYVPKNVEVGLPLQAYFRINAENAGQFERTLIIADEGSKVHYVEGCFTAGAKVETTFGRKVIEEINHNDKVLTHVGRFRKVNHLQKRKFTGDLYRIKYYGDSTETLELTEEHPILRVKRQQWNERNKRWKREWVKPGELNKGDYLVVPVERKVKTQNHHEYEVKKWVGRKTGYINEVVKVSASKEFFRLVGYYLAEGSISSGSYLNFSFSEKERRYIEDVKRLMKNVFGIEKWHESKHKKNHGISVVFSSVKLCRIFENFGKRNDLKAISNWMMSAETTVQAELIKGWFRGDGNYYSRAHKSGYKETFRINTTSENLVRRGRKILARLGIVAFINARDRSKEGRKTMYTLGVSGDQMQRFGEIVGINVPGEVNGRHRASMFGIDGQYVYLPIKSIKKRQVKQIDVYNFGVEGDESYVANGVAVHNCSAPVYSSGSLHAAVVEIVVKKGARVQYTTVQNWYKNVFNLVTKRAWVEEEGEMRWIDGNLGCLVGDSLISTPEGYKRIDAMEKGDVVYTLDLNSLKFVKSKIMNWKKTGVRTVYRLLTDDFREVRATDNHPFLKIQKRDGFSVYETEWCRLDQLKEGDLIAVQSELPDDGKSMVIDYKPKGRLLNVPFSIKETDEDLMWLLGAYLGDGCMEIDCHTGKGRRIDLAIPIDDKAYPRLEKVLTGMGLNYSQSKNGVTVRIGSTYMTELFRHLGFTGVAKTKTIPNWIYDLPLRQKLAFVEGYLDTDGHIRKKMTKKGRMYGQLTFACVSEELLKQMKLLMISCGLEPKKITTYIKERKLYKGKLKEYKTCYMSMNLDVNLDIIRNKTGVRNHFRFIKIRGISKLGKEAVYDIEVAGGHNFVANGILVHNSRLTMKYPACILAGRKARGETLSIAMAGSGQHQDAGAKMIHLAPETTSQIISKSISKNGGRASYRGLVKINKGAKGAKSKVVCDALILDSKSRSDTYPTNIILENEVSLEHEATVSKVGEDQLFYLMSRGLPEHEAEAMIVNGFLEPIMKQIPLEYAVEMNRLIEMEMEGSVG